MNLMVVFPILAVIVALRFFTRINILGWIAVSWISIYIFLNYGIDPPLPSSIIVMFMGIVSLALAAYATANSAYIKTITTSIINFVTNKKYTVPLVIFVIGLPLLVAYNVYISSSKTPQPPFTGRQIHPVPPAQISFKGKSIDLADAENPYRALESSEPAAFQQHVENGRKVYFQNCVFCHGDNMAGRGIYAHGFNPIPANFQDPTTIAMLQENYLFWRVAKGGPGLPEASTPWSSAMPAWENFLSEEEIWDVIIYMYEFTGHKPRAKEEEH